MEKLTKALKEGHVIDLKDRTISCKVSQINLDGTCLVVTEDSYRKMSMGSIVKLLLRFWSGQALKQALEGL